MPASPWKTFAAPENGREYLALLSYLPLNKWRALPKFMRYSLQIRRQLADSEGLIDRVLHGRKRTEQKILDLVGVGGRRISDEVRWEESSRAGDDGPDPTHGSNEIRSVASEWVGRAPKLGGS